VRAILSSLNGDKALEECRINQRSGKSLDLRVSATPFYLEHEVFSLFVVEDISHEKRRQVFERLFYHDILNLAGIIAGYAGSLEQTTDVKQMERITDILYRASFRLADVVKSQREIAEAESGELVVHPKEIHALDLLESVKQFYQGHSIAQDRAILIAPQARDVEFSSDPLLLERVIGNMVKNALEACQPGDTVTLSCHQDKQRVVFEVHNPSWMPPDVQLQIFQRSFSTKGAGRGLGTYSIKLFSEQYLKGTVNFTTSPECGTTFRACYALGLEPAQLRRFSRRGTRP
jgi:signal transduction histidine kinase